MDDLMHFAIVAFVEPDEEDDDESVGSESSEVMFAAPVDGSEVAYLRRALAHLRPLSDDDYINGLLVVSQTAARCSHILDGDVVYWCIEWEPGLLVVRIAPAAGLSWVALRSPVPNFGGREATVEELDAYDEDAPNPQYRLIFDAWDARYDAEHRYRRGFAPASDGVGARFLAALERVNSLAPPTDPSNKPEWQAWVAKCKANLTQWCGEGLRLPAIEE